MDGNYTYGTHTYIYQTVQNLKKMGVKRYYNLPPTSINSLSKLEYNFNNDAYRISVFNNAYSRITYSPHLHERKYTGMFTTERMSTSVERKETWHDVCVRVIEGLFTFYLDYIEQRLLPFPDDIDQMAHRVLMSMATMRWLPPGRGLFAMGTDHTYANGNAALNNCYAVSLKDNNLVKGAAWTMDVLMCGGGVGFATDWDGNAKTPNKEDFFTFVVDDTRQGWVCALELLLRAYIPDKSENVGKFPRFDLSKLRPYGTTIKGFGGTASGPEPLRVLLERVEIFLDAFLDWIDGKSETSIYTRYFTRLHEARSFYSYDYDFDEEMMAIHLAILNKSKPYNRTRLIMDIFNCIGYCVVSGNVRRSAQIALGDPSDLTFLDLKLWDECPERRPWMHLSNNTIRLWKDEDFEKIIPMVAERIKKNGEPGIVNMQNVKRYGRFSDERYGPDKATLLNPCAETELESYEPCCLSTIIPFNCIKNGVVNNEELMEACRWATFYATVVTTIPHHWPETNQVVSRNRRIGVSYTGIADVREVLGPIGLNKTFRETYHEIRKYNEDLAANLGIPRSIRVTVIKPEGTLSIIAGTSAGIHFPLCRFGIRRVAFGNDSNVLKALLEADYPYEKSTLTSNQTYILFPYKSNSEKTIREVGIFEKMSLALAAQKHFADNSVSFTGDFSKAEADSVETILASFIAQTKVISLMPRFEGTTDQYKHVPFQEVPEESYLKVLNEVKPVDWSIVFNLEKKDANKSSTAFCTGDSCTIQS